MNFFPKSSFTGIWGEHRGKSKLFSNFYILCHSSNVGPFTVQCWEKKVTKHSRDWQIVWDKETVLYNEEHVKCEFLRMLCKNAKPNYLQVK